MIASAFRDRCLWRWAPIHVHYESLDLKRAVELQAIERHRASFSA